MTIEFRTHPEANYNPYIVQFYCYDSDCPYRKGKGYVCSNGTYKWTTVTSKKGTTYRRKRWICDSCGKVMQGSISASVFE